MNKAFLSGNLGKDPELKYTNSGLPIAMLSLATKHRRKNKEGSYVDETDWHRVSLMGSQAENAAKYLKKGREVTIVGRLQTRKYTDQNNIERWVTEVKASEVHYHGSNNQNAGQQEYKQRANQNAMNNSQARGGGNSGTGANNNWNEAGDDLSDIPF